ncbi:tetratricopeptide repeat protein [Flavobacterium algicola]|uniref:tetratricopeptide repeat protein n=1 Tax=Flavobacterium algicola TaxID=556529 RepID=UPI001EFCBEF6|nr:tetratricopeptide repeat protein [Flavobacterium algicola]MCG9791860.1 tetratricopeptide repeat protein [Flavobacterium algicola]
MKNYLYLLLFFVSQSFFGQANFDKGNDLYQKGQYKEAAVAYENILKSGKQSADLYYNLANSYYKLNQVAPAIYNYEKALILNPDDIDIANNLKFAQKRTVDEIKVVSKVGFAKLLRDFTGIYHFNTWGWIAIGFAFAFLICFLGYYFSNLTLVKRAFFFGMFIFLVFVFASVASAMFEKSYYENEKPAIVFAEIAAVYGEPKVSSTTILDLHEGTKVYVLESVSHWKKIQLTDGSEGWIDSKMIKEVK